MMAYIPPDDARRWLATNLRQLRSARRLSQVAAARAAGIPRATWNNLEAGPSNPTLAVIQAVAAALHVGLDELLAPPRADGQLTRRARLPSRRAGAAVIRRLLPDPIPGVEVERFEIPAGGAFPGSPHTPGTREYLACERGSIELAAGGERHVLGEGDVLSFRGDQRHGYANLGRGVAVGYSVVLRPSG
jgi:transcriptional regulator with XRE-family HTH domain